MKNTTSKRIASLIAASAVALSGLAIGSPAHADTAKPVQARIVKVHADGNQLYGLTAVYNPTGNAIIPKGTKTSLTASHCGTSVKFEGGSTTLTDVTKSDLTQFETDKMFDEKTAPRSNAGVVTYKIAITTPTTPTYIITGTADGASGKCGTAVAPKPTTAPKAAPKKATPKTATVKKAAPKKATPKLAANDNRAPKATFSPGIDCSGSCMRDVGQRAVNGHTSATLNFSGYGKILAGHNYRIGKTVFSLRVGDKVRINTTSMRGDYRVVRIHSVNQKTFRLSKGSLPTGYAIQTCHWSGPMVVLVDIQKLGPAPKKAAAKKTVAHKTVAKPVAARAAASTVASTNAVLPAIDKAVAPASSTNHSVSYDAAVASKVYTMISVTTFLVLLRLFFRTFMS